MANEKEKRPNMLHRFLIYLYNSWFKGNVPLFLQLMGLVARRKVLDDINLYNAPLDTTGDGDPVPNYRTPDGSGNDQKHFQAGAVDTAFGRNMPPASSFDPLNGPSVQVVAAKLLERKRFRPAGMQLNVLAAAWIQAMAHDWFGHNDSTEEVTLSNGTSSCPMQSFSFKKTLRRPDGAFDNFRTHWWDSSFVYGQEDVAVGKARTGENGKLFEGEARGVLPKNEDGTNRVGDPQNGWLGVALLQEIFLREHNAICDAIAAKHPELDDDTMFNQARMTVSAIVAKIHTVDWTVELLKTETLDKGMHANWYGLPKALDPSKDGPPALFSLIANATDNKGVPYCLTEEFVSVYRLHPLVPDGLLIDGELVPILELSGMLGEQKLLDEGAPLKYWDAVVSLPCGNLELFNYPRGLRNVPPTDREGRDLMDEKVDLAALDIFRDRERGLRRYNDFRRGLVMEPFKSIKELAGHDEEACAALEDVYGVNGIEEVDLQVGLLAEKKMPGFAISETAFLIFLLMASRRLEADRFFTSGYNEGPYGDVGFEWVNKLVDMRDLLKRHFPEVDAKIPEGCSAFKPYAPWPDEYLN